MNCRELIDFLADYLSDELPAEQRTRFQEHMDRCRPCAEYLATYRHTILLCRQAFCDATDPDRPPAPPETLIQAILDARHAKPCDPE
ncbi:MAG: anti-sigma factor [Planctomycetota bacterium]